MHWSDDRRGVALRHGELRAGRVAGIAMPATIAPRVGARNRRRCLALSWRNERRILLTCRARQGSWHGHSPFWSYMYTAYMLKNTVREFLFGVNRLFAINKKIPFGTLSVKGYLFYHRHFSFLSFHIFLKKKGREPMSGIVCGSRGGGVLGLAGAGRCGGIVVDDFGRNASTDLRERNLQETENSFFFTPDSKFHLFAPIERHGVALVRQTKAFIRSAGLCPFDGIFHRTFESLGANDH